MAAMGGEEKPSKKYDIKPFRGLVDNVASIKEIVESERAKSRALLRAQQETMKVKEVEAQVIQKELSVQLRCAGRSYQSILSANHELTENLREEEARRLEEVEDLERTIRQLKGKLAQADKPWKEEVSKRDLKILKLQEAAGEQETRLRAAEAKIPPILAKFEQEIKVRDEAKESVVREIDLVRQDFEEQLKAKDVILEQEQKRAHTEAMALKVKIMDIEEKASKISRPYEKQIKVLELSIQGLQQQLDAVDYSPYERQIEVKEAGYNKLVKDFRIDQSNNNSKIEKMRASFEDVIEKLDKQIQDNEKEHQRRMQPWYELVEKRENEIEMLKNKIKEAQEEEAEVRAAEAEIKATLEKELEAAKKGMDIAIRESMQAKKELQAKLEEEVGDNGPWKRMKALEFKLEEVTQKCEYMLRSKDRELKEKVAIVNRLQARLLAESEERNAMDKEWDRRVQKKEEGYGKVVADLSYAEGQILQERERTAAAIATIKKREETIAMLKAEHSEELRFREIHVEELVAEIRRMEEEVDAANASQDYIRSEWEARYDAFRRRCEERVEDLMVEIAKRDRAREEVEKELDKLRHAFEKARVTWEDKERELEVMIRSRDRAVTALKNEIEFINDSWEIKYNRLMGLFDKLQKKYDELLGPTGVAEVFRRARDLKEENKDLVIEILELKEAIKKQKRQIRDLQLDIDGVMKETADIIAEKERGIAEMVGDYAKLQNKFKHSEELRIQQVKELQAEKIALALSFEDRILQLEQLVESLRFTDRQELVNRIAVWKHAYERICIARDELEDGYKEIVDTKEAQLRGMSIENSEVREEVAKAKLAGEVAYQELEEYWKKQETLWRLEREALNKEIVQLKLDVDAAILKANRALNKADTRVEDPEKEQLRQQLQERTEQMHHIERGIEGIVAQNTELHEAKSALENRMETAAEDWEPQIRWRDERYEAMVKEHEALKEVLQMEMKRAQETCKSIEEQVRRFPNPFEAEMKELKDKYAQSQTGIQKVSMENLELREQMLDYQEKSVKEKEALEDQLRLAHRLLTEVSTLDTIKKLPKGELLKLEEETGMDLDHDGRIG